MSVQSETTTATRTTISKQPKFRVIMHNDDVTTMEFVMAVLIAVFHKSESDAEFLTMTIHHEGAVTVGVYSREVAEQKIEDTNQLSSEFNFPLKVTLEEE